MAFIDSDKTMKLLYPKTHMSRPHVTTEYDDSALTNQASDSQKNIVLLGSATEGDPNNVYEIKSSVEARAVFGSGDLVNAMELIWNPDGDFFQNGGTVLARRVENATQASLTKGPITFTSQVFGERANHIGVSLTKDPISNAYTLHVEYEPKTYSNSYNNLGNIFAIYSGGPHATAKAYGYKVEGSLAGATKLTLAMGDSQSELKPVKEFDLTRDAFSTVGKLLAAIDTVPGFQATTLKSCSQIKSNSLDLTDGDGFIPVGDENHPTTVKDFYGDLMYATRFDPYITISVNRYAAPTNVKATATSDGANVTAEVAEVPLQVFQNVYLQGGDNGHVPVSWSELFKSVHGHNVYYIVPLTAEESVHAELQEFLQDENILGYNYMSFVGGGYNETFNTLLNRQLNLRSNRVALVANSGTYTSLNGEEVHIPAYMMAAYVAGIASSLGVGEAVTNKYLSLVSLDQNFSGSELDQLDENGIIAIEDIINRNASGGFRIVEDVTTYNSTNEKTKNLVSMQELTDFLFDDLRIYLEERYIGASVRTTTAQLISTDVEAFLQQRVADGMLASYDSSSVQTMISGDKVYVSFSCAPSREMRTILVKGTYTNFTAEATGNSGLSSLEGGNGVNPRTDTIAGIIAQNHVKTDYIE